MVEIKNSTYDGENGDRREKKGFAFCILLSD